VQQANFLRAIFFAGWYWHCAGHSGFEGQAARPVVGLCIRASGKGLRWTPYRPPAMWIASQVRVVGCALTIWRFDSSIVRQEGRVCAYSCGCWPAR
jgi:hypothetical protein